jgi:hypothetical protein
VKLLRGNGTSLAHELSDRPTFKAVIIYEDHATGIRAKSFYEELVYELKGKCDLNLELWSSQVLSIPKIGNSAAQVAAQADVVLLSLHGNAGLPAKIREWVKTWSRLIADNNAALVVVLADGSQTSAILLEVEYELKDKRELSTFYHIHFESDSFFFRQQLKPWSTYYRRSRLTE